MPRSSARRVGLGAATAATLLTAIALRAQGGAGAAGATPPKPLVPMSASSLAISPDTHWGDTVSMLGYLDTVLSKTVFTVDQDRTASSEKSVLVIAPYLSAAIDRNTYITVVGEVFKFDPLAVASRAKDGYVLDLAPAIAQRWLGRPAVFATSVITPQYTDVGKRQPPPMTPAEMTLRSAMQAISTNTTAVRTGLDTPEADKLNAQIAALAHGFKQAGEFFQSPQGVRDAVDTAGKAAEFVDTMDKAVAAAKWDDAKAALASLNGLCTSCHTVHRERLDDGTFRFKK